MAELLADRASHVTALDKSPEMLRIARARLQAFPAGKIDLVQGDFTELPFAKAMFDTVLFHQVLHYAQEPETVLAEAARVTHQGGRSEEHTSELQSLMRISYAVFCLKQKKTTKHA